MREGGFPSEAILRTTQNKYDFCTIKEYHPTKLQLDCAESTGKSLNQDGRSDWYSKRSQNQNCEFNHKLGRKMTSSLICPFVHSCKVYSSLADSKSQLEGLGTNLQDPKEVVQDVR